MARIPGTYKRVSEENLEGFLRAMGKQFKNRDFDECHI